MTEVASAASRTRATRRFVLGASAVLLMGASGAACAVGPGQPEARRTQPVTLDSWSRDSTFTQVADRYSKGPGQADLVTLSVTTMASPLDFQEKLLGALAANTPPDFTTIELNITPLFNVRKIYVNISREFSQLKVKDQLPGGLLRYCQFEGKTYQLPYSGGGTGIYWNKNLFDKVGLPSERAPKTWDELTDAAVKVTRAPDVWGVSMPYNGSPTFEFMPWVYANGGKLLSDDGKKSVVNSEEGAGAFILWNDLSARRQVVPEGIRSSTSFDAAQYFLQGRLAIVTGGTSLIARAKKEAPDLQFGTAVRPIGPRGTRTGCSPGGETIGFLPNNKYRAETWRLMEWLIGPDAQIEFKVGQTGSTPILAGQYDNKYFREEPRFLPFRDAEQVITPTWTTRFEDIKAVMLPAYTGTMRGEKEPRAALREMADGIDRILATA